MSVSTDEGPGGRAVGDAAAGQASGAAGVGAAEPGLTVEPSDPRYATLSRGFNQRWTSEPRYIRLLTPVEGPQYEADAIAAVRDALERGLRPTVRGGGHCYEDFVENTGGAILDMSLRTGVAEARDKFGAPAYAVEAGATNWDVYTTLFRRFGRTIPAGSCYSVGAGGHICGGGYGLLSRRHGLTVDHLVQVDLVTVRDGRPAVTRVHRDDPPGTPERELFWAHTGGGGGNFGLILRYYFTPDIPEPPPAVWLSSVAWPWDGLLRQPDDFARIVRNFGDFFAAHSSPAERVYQGLFSLLKLTHKTNGNVAMVTQWDGADVAPLEAFVAAITAGTATKAIVQAYSVGGHFLPYPEQHRRMPWFQATMTLNGSGANQRGKYKSAYMRKPFTDHMIGAAYKWLTRDVPQADLTQTLLQVDSYGCQVNAVRWDETAVPQRDSILKLQYQTYWTDPAQDQAHLDYMRAFYREMYAETGGIPEVSGLGRDLVTDGAYVNYPDVDLGVASDPAPAYPRLYYKDNYARLRNVKRYWDGANYFRHKQSVLP